MTALSKIIKVLVGLLPFFAVATIVFLIMGDMWLPLGKSCGVISVALLVAIIIIKFFVREESKKVYGSFSGNRYATEIFDLTESNQGRMNIVNAFNRRYQLNLTHKQVRQIVSASYLSYFWRREVFDMSKEYPEIRDWQTGETDWLRVYLYVYPNVNISQDFKAQYQYVVDSYKRIFEKMDASKYLTMEDFLKEVNRRYFTFFNESMFIQVVHFMEKNGFFFRYPSGIHVENESEAEKLMKKYDG